MSMYSKPHRPDLHLQKHSLCRAADGRKPFREAAAASPERHSQ